MEKIQDREELLREIDILKKENERFRSEIQNYSSGFTVTPSSFIERIGIEKIQSRTFAAFASIYEDIFSAKDKEELFQILVRSLVEKAFYSRAVIYKKEGNIYLPGFFLWIFGF